MGEIQDRPFPDSFNSSRLCLALLERNPADEKLWQRTGKIAAVIAEATRWSRNQRASPWPKLLRSCPGSLCTSRRFERARRGTLWVPCRKTRQVGMWL
jgi:hypothetical protein